MKNTYEKMLYLWELIRDDVLPRRCKNDENLNEVPKSNSKRKVTEVPKTRHFVSKI